MSFSARSPARDRAVGASALVPTLAIMTLGGIMMLVLALIGLAQGGSLNPPGRGASGVQGPRLSVAPQQSDPVPDLSSPVDLEPIVQVASVVPVSLPTSATVETVRSTEQSPQSTTASRSTPTRTPTTPLATRPPVVTPPAPIDPPALGQPTAKDCRRALGRNGMRIPRRCTTFCLTFVSTPGHYVPRACQRWCRAPFWAYRWADEQRPWCTAPTPTTKIRPTLVPGQIAARVAGGAVDTLVVTAAADTPVVTAATDTPVVTAATDTPVVTAATDTSAATATK